MKFNPAVAGYIATAVAAAVAIYVIKGWLENPFNRLGQQLDAAAEDYGNATAVAANAPQLAYAQARHDYALAIGVTVNDLLAGNYGGWPTREDWYDGRGPAGYTYGSQNYPAVEQPSFLDSLF